jgi:hypothetical protein
MSGTSGDPSLATAGRTHRGGTSTFDVRSVRNGLRQFPWLLQHRHGTEAALHLHDRELQKVLFVGLQLQQRRALRPLLIGGVGKQSREGMVSRDS